MNMLMEITGLSFQYAKERIFTGVDFSVQEGDFIALIGPNGAGKSTLLKLLLGELTIQKGSIKLFGQDIHEFKQWPRLGYMPQTGMATGVNIPATVEEMVQANLFSQIGLMRLAKKEHREKVRAALSKVDMSGYGKSLFSQLSGGQQQRVLLARVLVNDPAIMILDEPTTGIDAKGVRELLDLLQNLNKNEKATILMVTHDMARTADVVTRTLCLEEGSLLELTECQLQRELTHRHHHHRPDVRTEEGNS